LKLSTRGRYGLKAMFDLAQHAGEGPISLKSIAERQDISEHYLEQLVSGLRKSGLVKSVRGAQGGYVLGREATKIKVDPECCEKADFCVTRTIWEKVRDSISEVLDSITLDDMVQDAAKKENERKYYMYYI